MKTTKELKLFLLILLFIIIAEIVTSFFSPTYGLSIHAALLISLLVLSAFWQTNSNISNLLLCLAIAPLIRVFSLSLPLSYLPSYAWYILAGIPMLVAAVTIMRIQQLKLTDIGINFKKPIIQIAITFTGIPFGTLEYLILRPAPITVGLSTLAFVLLAISFIAATGFVEELVFRGVFQNTAIKTFGTKFGLISVALVFAALHIGWLNMLDVVLVFCIGLFFGILMLKTGSISGISLSHGLTNVFLFLVLPSANLISVLAPK